MVEVNYLSASNVRVIRRPLFLAEASSGQVVAWLLFAGIAVSGSPPGADDLVAMPLLLTVLTYVIWLIGWHTRIVVTERGMVVINGFRVHEFSWRDVTDVRIGDGLEIELFSGSVVWSTQFGFSRLGRFITGYPSYRVARETISAAWRSVVPEPPDSIGYTRGRSSSSYRSSVRTPLLPFIVCLAVYGVISLSYGIATGVWW